MARHYAPSDKKSGKKLDIKAYLQRIELPSFRISSLPKLISLKKRKLPRRKYQRVFSAPEMLRLRFILVRAYLLSAEMKIYSRPTRKKWIKKEQPFWAAPKRHI